MLCRIADNMLAAEPFRFRMSCGATIKVQDSVNQDENVPVVT
jgi:hypothetical protein